MLYCTYNALNRIANDGDYEFAFIAQNGVTESSVTCIKEQGKVDTCYKDGIGAVENYVSLICEYGKYEFSFTKFTVDWELQLDLERVKVTQKGIKKLLKKTDRIMCLTEEVNNLSELYVLRCVKEASGKMTDFALDKTIYNEVNYTQKEIEVNLSNKKFAIVPLRKENENLMYNGINIGLNQVYTFYKQFCPKLFYDINKILSKYVEVPEDFVNYRYCVVNINQKQDKYKNELLEISLIKELSVEEIAKLDNTGKSHLFIVSNYTNVDIPTITESLKSISLNNNNIQPEVLFKYIKKAKLKDVSWIEDYLIKENSYDGNDFIVKMLKTCKKVINKDKLFNHIIEKGTFQNFISVLKSDNSINVLDYEDKYIETVGESSYALRSFVEVFNNIKLDKIKEALILYGLKGDYAYYITEFFKSSAYNKVNLFKEFKSRGSGNQKFLYSLNDSMQDYIRENECEAELVNEAMEFLLESDTDGSNCYQIHSHSYNNFSNYKSDITAFRDRISEKYNLYYRNRYK